MCCLRDEGQTGGGGGASTHPAHPGAAPPWSNASSSWGQAERQRGDKEDSMRAVSRLRQIRGPREAKPGGC